MSSELVISWGVDRPDPCEFSSPFIRSLIFCPLLPVRCNEHLVGGNYRETVNQQVFVVCVSEVLWWVQKERKKQLCPGGADAIPPQETLREGRTGCVLLTCWCESSGEDGQGAPWSGRQLSPSRIYRIVGICLSARISCGGSAKSQPLPALHPSFARCSLSASCCLLVETEIPHKAGDLSEIKVRYMPGMVSGIKWVLSKWWPLPSPSLL